MSQKCSNCQEPLQPGWPECPACTTPVSTGLICPACLREVKSHWQKCPGCSAVLTGSGGQKQAEGPAFGLTPSPLGGGGNRLQLQAGEVLAGRFTLQGELGRGSFGTVYLAHDKVMNDRPVALKITALQAGQGELAVRQLKHEFTSRKKIIDKRHILEAELPMEADNHGQLLLLLPMDHAEGGSLRRWLVANPDQQKRKDQALDYFKQACAGVQALHKAGLVHLDLKPENLLIQGGRIKVSDFGLSRSTVQMSVASPELLRDGIGTPAYMAPEQIKAARPQDVDHLADIYALGVILFELLDGDPPYVGNKEQILDKINQGVKPKLRGVEDYLAQVIWRCLENDKEKRYADTERLMQALEVDDFSVVISAIEASIAEEKFEQSHVLLKGILEDGIAQDEYIRLFDLLTCSEKEKNRICEESSLEQIKKSGEVDRFVSSRKGEWDHSGWLRFKKQIEEQYGAINSTALGNLLEDAKCEYLKNEIETAEQKRLANPLVCPVTGMEFVEVVGGAFEMGDSQGYSLQFEKPVHIVTLPIFKIGKHQVTQSQWEIVMGVNPSCFKESNRPVENVSWEDCKEFIDRLNKITGRHYRLPSEAEWEYSAKSGAKNECWSGTNISSFVKEYCWFGENSGSQTHSVGEKQPNSFGIHDMSGNVWEWCEDVFLDYKGIYEKNAVYIDPVVKSKGDLHVIKGGAFTDIGQCFRASADIVTKYEVRCSNRLGLPRISRDNIIGFRLVLTTKSEDDLRNEQRKLNKIHEIENLINKRHYSKAKKLIDHLSFHDALTDGLPQDEASRLQQRLQAAKAEAVERQRLAEKKRLAEEERKRRENPLFCPVTGMEFVEVPGGSFDMGDIWGDGYESEKPVHRVSLDGFLMGKYPVTQAQWQKVMGDNPSVFKGSDRPVEQVSWEDAQQFIQKLNRQSGRSYRLPTEAEWEYAARSGGKREKWAECNHEAELGHYAWYGENSGNQTHPVGQKRPNGLGLYDMSGNVWEWCQDWYGVDYYQHSSSRNPPGPGQGPFCVLRGGSWFSVARLCRSSVRGVNEPGHRIHDLGFRLVLRAGQ